ncbi:MAG: peptidase, partial [Segetibacter sp.]|nr:peptidase [Segetibacter sp.]
YEVPASLSVVPSISEDQALSIAKNQVGAKKYAWEEVQARISATSDENVKKLLQIELNEYLPKGQLVIVKDFTNKEKADMRLAFKFNLYAAEPISRGYIYVDAHTGKVLLYDAIIKHASDPTTVTTRYAGNRVIYTGVISGTDPGNGQLLLSSHPQTELTYVPGSPTHVLRDDTRGKTGIETFDLNNVGGLPLSVGALYAQAKSFTDQDNNWTLTEHKRGGAEGGANEAENDDVAWDAHWGAEMVYDYWGKRHNRKSYDGKDAGIKSYIHYGPAYDNAFWNGTAMTYGDGSGQQAGGFKALTSLDVCGHEIGHGVCSNTSDLVYANESGAMNEGFSDIWAACVENFAIKEVDPNLSNLYKPFFIGEQISYSANPLRRMDNPKAVGDPDTRYGKNYINPNCTPTLANDECGVHTNSNVLNKWFYLLTLGSGAGSGPDKSYVIPGADDAKRDDTTGGVLVQDIVPYSVTGLGFAISEQLAFLTEIMLSSTATYDEAREMSIAAAKAFSGDPCGQTVQSVTNAWFAVGVGGAFVAPCTVKYGFITQPGLTVTEGTSGIGCTGTDSIAIPILLAANSSATITIAGTATANVDYTIPSVSFVNNTSAVKVDTIHIYVNNDGVIEPEETINLTLAITNLGTNTSNNAFTITIGDDDVTPVIGTDSVTLLNENFESVIKGFNLPTGWVETLEIPEVVGIDPTTAGKNHWGVFQPGNPNTSKTLAVTGRIVDPVLGTTTSPDATYINTSPSQTRASTPLIDARGLSNIKLSFDFTVQGEVDPNGTDFEAFGKFDYMEITYSYDGITYLSLGKGFIFAMAQPYTGIFDNALPAFLNNKKFYLAFRWYNDTNAGGLFSVSIDNVMIKGVPKRIETIAGRLSNETINGAQDVYFYSNPDGNIIAKVNATGNNNYGCVTASLEKAGNSTFTLYSDNTQDNKVGDKIIRITPTTNNPNGTYTISLYFTEEEILAIENATAVARQQLYIYKTSASAFAGATAENTVKTAATYTAVNGGGVFTATFNTGFSGFAIGAPVAKALPITCTEFKATRSDNGVTLNWKVTEEQDNRKFEIERSTDGVNFKSIATLSADSHNGGLYNYRDNSTNGLTVYYRLRQTNADGNFRYICDVQQLKAIGKVLVIGNAYPNPAKGMVSVKVTSSESQKLHVELINNIGQLFNTYVQRISQGESSIPVRFNNAPSGTYMLRFKDENGNLLNRQSIIIQH